MKYDIYIELENGHKFIGDVEPSVDNNMSYEEIKTKVLEDVMNNYPGDDEAVVINFGVRNGRQWNQITNLSPIFNNSKRIGYTCRNGLYMIRKTIEGKTKVIFSSRKEEDVINYLNVH